MITSEKIDALAADYIAASAELKNALFDKENPHFKSKYATLAQIRDAVAPVLAKHGLAVTQGTVMVAGAWAVTTRLLHKSGQWIESLYPLTGNKPQEMGSAYTYARRYSISAICGIASEADDDGNAANEAPAWSAPTKTATRAEFQRLCAELAALKNSDDYQVWAIKNDPAINALNPDLLATLTASMKVREFVFDLDAVRDLAELSAWNALHKGEYSALPQDQFDEVATAYRARKTALTPTSATPASNGAVNHV